MLNRYVPTIKPIIELHTPMRDHKVLPLYNEKNTL